MPASGLSALLMNCWAALLQSCLPRCPTFCMKEKHLACQRITISSSSHLHSCTPCISLFVEPTALPILHLFPSYAPYILLFVAPTLLPFSCFHGSCFMLSLPSSSESFFPEVAIFSIQIHISHHTSSHSRLHIIVLIDT